MSNRTPRLRCAVYTRKSTDEGLDQEFNSLDAQREACIAFIASQAGLGWNLIPYRYDDGGISGGTMDRPALQRLLQDIRDRRVDVVVVYKIDRLTRSLMDFARIVEIFDGHSVSFVSVTQQFNTTTSMGRLTLNVLLSFAQFEREVTAERIRDKIAASKRKGMWMGGKVPLGYRAENRKLVIDPEQADQVRHIFQRYLALKSVTALADELDRETSRQEEDHSDSSTVATSCPHPGRGRLYHMLANPIYIGKVRHRGNLYDGEHEPILNAGLFEQVQALLASQAPNRQSRKNQREPHLLTGLLFDETGDRLSPTHANKKGKRYRYYVSDRLKASPSMESSGSGWRLSAAEIEGVILSELRSILNDHTRISDWIGRYAATEQIAQGLQMTRHICDQLDEPANVTEREKWLRTIFSRITLTPHSVRYLTNPTTLVAALTGSSVPVPDDRTESDDACSADVIDRAMVLKRRGQEARILIQAASSSKREPDHKLIEMIAKAHALLGRLTNGKTASIPEAAAAFGMHRADVSRILPLAFLSPSITDAILNGTQPAHLTVRTLTRLVEIPALWASQTQLVST